MAITRLGTGSLLRVTDPSNIITDYRTAKIGETFFNSGTYGSYILIPQSTFNGYIEMWGAGGAGSGGDAGANNGGVGGPGGFVAGYMKFIANQTYILHVGQGGIFNSNSRAFGGSGGGNAPNSMGGGGGATGLFLSSATFANSLIIAGAGGGGSSRYSGGFGGGLSAGGGATCTQTAASPGTQSGGGAGGYHSSYGTAPAGGQLSGGNPGTWGGGGGSGYYGGGGGIDAGCYGGSGAGGCSYTSSQITGATHITGSMGNTTAPNNSNTYRGTSGNGGAARADGQNGKMLITLVPG